MWMPLHDFITYASEKHQNPATILKPSLGEHYSERLANLRDYGNYFYNLQPGSFLHILKKAWEQLPSRKKRKTVISYRNVHRTPPGLLRYANVSAPMSSLRRHTLALLASTRHDLSGDRKRG